jgi:hypothetical protein
MKNNVSAEVRIQREYYSATASIYDELHSNESNEHSFALAVMLGIVDHLNVKSILDMVVEEMMRVSRFAIFISDSNNFGQGRRLTRWLKQILNFAGLWPLADFIKTRGKGYSISEEDGLGYSYSVFQNFRQIKRSCTSTHVFNTVDAGRSPYGSAKSVALLGIK